MESAVSATPPANAPVLCGRLAWGLEHSTPPPPGEESTPSPLPRPFPCALPAISGLGFRSENRGFLPVEPSSWPTRRDTGHDPGTDRVCRRLGSAVPARAHCCVGQGQVSVTARSQRLRCPERPAPPSRQPPVLCLRSWASSRTSYSRPPSPLGSLTWLSHVHLWFPQVFLGHGSSFLFNTR